MPRHLRFTPPGVPVHVIQRGNNRTPTFRHRLDFLRYHSVLDNARRRTGCAVHAYVLMTNHVHLLVTPSRGSAISEMMQILGRQYVRYFNARYLRTGTLWEGRFRSTAIDSERYFFTCARYIELNPVRAGMAQHPRDYPWSSFRANAEGANETLIEPHSLYCSLGLDWEERARAYAQLFEGGEDAAKVNAIRRATHSGSSLLDLGSESGT